jgi:hypothetical protein
LLAWVRARGAAAHWQEVAESLTAAIAHDSTFALAYYGLYRAITWGNSGPIFQRSGTTITTYTADDVVQAALRHLDHAPPRQRRLLEFVPTTNRADRTPARAVVLAGSFAALTAAPTHSPPERVTALLRRHVYRLAQGRYDDAWDLLRQAAVLHATGPEVLAATVVHQLVTGAHQAEADDAARQLSAMGDGRPLLASAALAWGVAAFAPPDSARAAVGRLLATGGDSCPVQLHRAVEERRSRAAARVRAAREALARLSTSLR